MKAIRPLSEAEEQRVVALYLQNDHSIALLCEKFHQRREAIRKILQQNNVKVLSGAEKKRKSIDVCRVVHLYKIERLCPKQISLIFNVGVTFIKTLLKTEGVYIKTANLWTKEENELLASLIARGILISDMSKYFPNRTYGSIYGKIFSGSRQTKYRKSIEILKGSKYGSISILDESQRVNGYRRVKCRCDCGNEFVMEWDILRQYSKGCEQCDWRGTLTQQGFANIHKCAKLRNIDFSVSREYIHNLFLSQNGKCALSGGIIWLEKCEQPKTASLDRIDSTRGYIKGNVQWVHKEINLLKRNLSEEMLLDYCRKIIATHQAKQGNVH